MEKAFLGACPRVATYKRDDPQDVGILTSDLKYIFPCFTE